MLTKCQVTCSSLILFLISRLEMSLTSELSPWHFKLKTVKNPTHYLSHLYSGIFSSSCFSPSGNYIGYHIWKSQNHLQLCLIHITGPCILTEALKCTLFCICSHKFSLKISIIQTTLLFFQILQSRENKVSSPWHGSASSSPHHTSFTGQTDLGHWPATLTRQPALP